MASDRMWPMAGLRERRLPGASIGAAACLPGSELEAHPERLGVLQPPRA